MILHIWLGLSLLSALIAMGVIEFRGYSNKKTKVEIASEWLVFQVPLQCCLWIGYVLMTLLGGKLT